ncbi:MAG: hypothetical protein MUP98_15220, partial [Candidatus Aminicenantes bacterium]|nr:hypothetical protein [Candidatus Aminicenantes bacterium]
MENQKDLIKEAASIIEEIEDQLDQILSKKRKEIESDLETKIERDRKDAQNKMEQVEQELSGERESLKSYRVALSEFDKEKREIKKQIQDHLKRAAEYQPQIESLAAKTIGELKIVMRLNEKLEDVNLAAVSRVELMKVELKDKIGTSPDSALDQTLSLPTETTEQKPSVETIEQNDIQSSLDNELEKLKKIKELLGDDSVVRKELTEIETNSLPEAFGIPVNNKPQDKIVEKQSENKVGEDIVSTQAEEPVPDEIKVPVIERVDIPAVDLDRTLEKFRKSINGEKGIKLTYFENNKKMILDGQDIFNAIDKDVEEAQKLYDKLSKTQSPKEQFFTKQEIIWHQETLREFILTTLKVCEKENAVLSQSTADVLNISVLKKILDKVSRENWSNKD